MANDKRVLDVQGDKLEIVWDGNVWVAPSSGTQHARKEDAMREELYRYLSDCGELPENCNDPDDLDLSEYGVMTVA